MLAGGNMNCCWCAIVVGEVVATLCGEGLRETSGVMMGRPVVSKIMGLETIGAVCAATVILLLLFPAIMANKEILDTDAATGAVGGEAVSDTVLE